MGLHATDPYLVKLGNTGDLTEIIMYPHPYHWTQHCSLEKTADTSDEIIHGTLDIVNISLLVYS